MKKQEKLLAERVLDYWYALEFLSQDKYPDSWEKKNKIQTYKKKIAKGTAEKKTIEDFISLVHEENLYETIAREAIDCGMKKWGNLTIYIGKVKREKCIDCISKVLSFDLEDGERPEKSTDKIAWVSLQLSPEGNYIEHSLSLSTIIWALNQVKFAKGNISDSLDEKLYDSAMKELEKKFFDKNLKVSLSDNKEKHEKTVEIFPQRDTQGEEKIQTFSASAVSMKKLRDLYKEIEKRYIKGNIENTEDENDAYEKVYGISFLLFADEATKNKSDNDNYLGLAHNYYSNDIKLVLERIRSGALVKEGCMEEDILKYITALENEDTSISKRINLVDLKHQQKHEYLKQINEILAVENAPLGKWPSRFMPAFMQQVAVNLAVGKGKSELYGVNGKIFSVNGPPGTGKTTLLKEIVVNNIIERAILLSEYNNPDDAFVSHDFQHGDGPEAAYSKYTRHWYSLKNDSINDYSMLVASCNNGAVENISKELPKSILGDLDSLDDDTDELRNLLSEVGKLFDANESDVTENTHQDETYKDIYFTKYAQELLDNNDNWGLVAAPLGKKLNLSNFYNKVLYPLGRDFYKNKEMAPNRIKSYAAAKRKFEEQLKVVRKMQNSLKKAGTFLKEKIQVEEAAFEIRKQCENAISISRTKLENCNQRIENLTKDRDEYNLIVVSRESDLHLAKCELQEKEKELRSARDKMKECQQNELAVRNSVGILTRIFNKSKYQVAMRLADDYKEESNEHEEHISKLELEIVHGKEKIKQKETLKNQAQQQYEECMERIKDITKNIKRQEEKITACQEEILRAFKKMEAAKNKYVFEIEKFAGKDIVDSRAIIDEKFVEKLFSDDVNESTAAQVANPWFTQRYNREREKLFAYALRMNKEFIVSSNHCRDNFVTLSHYWGFKTGDENERIIFHKKDKENMVPALFQTLFLLVPVLSSTFASVGKLLSDVKQSGVIGMLIIDEAGQAQPQMALGALYRSRRAVIVGDAKQIEPVVTDDLILLKKAYNDEALKPYKKKNLSVQGFADRLNAFGTYLDNGTDYPEWVGCPLLVHRRCISPMFDISNEISYNGIMKQQTKPLKKEKAEKFVYNKSQWINVKGKEKGNKNHFVEAQGQKVCELLEVAFAKNSEPDIYIISPFTTVVFGIKEYIRKYCFENRNITKINSNYLLDSEQKKIGTVHTFQGREADEVIFLLGCDTSKEAKGAIRWVNKNIVNVAVTRAKYRLYVIGDEAAWKESNCINRAKEIIDTFAIKEIKSILEGDMPEHEKQEALARASRGLPSITSFATLETEVEDDIVDYSVDTSGLIKGLNEDFLKTELSTEQLEKFGFKDITDMEALSEQVKENLLLGMKLFFLLEPVYKVNERLDASCCAILFCKAMELQMKDCFMKSLKEIFPAYMIKGHGKGRNKVSLKEAQDKELTMGAFVMILKNKSQELGNGMEAKGKNTYDEVWWKAFGDKLDDCTKKRNQCCHSGLFTWNDQALLLFDMFEEDTQQQKRSIKIGGILFESKVGKELYRL